MILRNCIPILYSHDIRKTTEYYVDVFGFDHKWEWDDPPSFGGVSKDAVQLFFSSGDEEKFRSCIAIMLDDVDGLYERIKSKGGKVFSEPHNKQWGLREMLVQDLDGNFIRFGEGITSGRKNKESFPESIKITERIPTVNEFQTLVKSVGWNNKSNEQAEKVLKAPLFAAVAEDSETNKVVGCVLLLGDGASFYYIKDMMVHPDYQSRQIGSALMRKLNNWIENNAPDDVLVGLYTGENLASFYRQFGFKEAFGMTKRIGTRQK